MRQLMYASSSRRPGHRTEIDAIFEQSRHNNAIDGVTELLYTDGVRFLQVLEGPDDSVEQTFGRIRRDDRHHGIVVLADRPSIDREFGYWAMAHRTPREPGDDFDRLMLRRLAGASDEIRGAFLDLVTERCAA